MSKKHFLRISEADTKEFLENIQEIFPQYYIHLDICSMINSPTTRYCVIQHKRVKYIQTKRRKKKEKHLKNKTIMIDNFQGGAKITKISK